MSGVGEAVEFVMVMALDDIIDADIDEMNLLACDQYGNRDLQDIYYEIVSLNKNKTINIKVLGYVRNEE